jgi:hypothetical protein
MNRLWCVVVLSFASGCIDLEGAWAICLDGGGACTVADSGAPMSQEDAGTVDAGPPVYDGGPVCTGSTNRRLRCDAPITLGTGTNIVSGALVESSAGLIAGWAGTTVEVREYALDGGARTLIAGEPASNAQLSLDAKGALWAAAWLDRGATAMKCTTGTGVPLLVANIDGGVLDTPTLALNTTGGVALSARVDPRLVAGSVAVGCPASLAPVPVGSTNSVGVVSTSGVGDGFRYVWTDQINAYNGSLNILSMANGVIAGQTSTPSNQKAPQGLGVAASTSGTTVFTAYSAINTSDQYELGLWATSADLAGDGELQQVSTVEPGWWSVGRCGPGCMATGVIAYGVPGPATVHFFSDDVSAARRGSWDVACGLQPQMNDGSTVSLAPFAKRLGVLLTSRTTARLYLCDLPPDP